MKNDFLRECTSDVGMIPIDEFTKTYCLRCINQGCTRSAGNNHMFVQRAQNWEKRLFSEVQRAGDKDPTFDDIRAKLFVSRQPSLGNVSSYVAPAPKMAIVVPEETAPEQEELLPPEAEEEAPEAPEPSIVVPTSNTEPVPHQEIQNTPFEQGMMTGEAAETMIPVGGTVFFDDE